MKADLFLGPELQHLVFPQGQGGPGAAVVIVAKRNHGIETVIPSRQLQDHEDMAVLPGHALNQLTVRRGVEGEHGVLQKSRHGPAKRPP